MLVEVTTWVLIGFFSLVGGTILYVLGDHLFWKASPEVYKARALRSIMKDFRRYFGYLFDKGYRVIDAGYDYQTFGNWWVTLASDSCEIHLLQDRLELSLSFLPRNAPRKPAYDLGTMIYFVTKGREFVPYFEGNLSWGRKKQLERLASLLSKYHDQIVGYFEKDFRVNRSALDASQATYSKLLAADFHKKHLKRS